MRERARLFDSSPTGRVYHRGFRPPAAERKGTGYHYPFNLVCHYSRQRYARLSFLRMGVCHSLMTLFSLACSGVQDTPVILEGLFRTGGKGMRWESLLLKCVVSLGFLIWGSLAASVTYGQEEGRQGTGAVSVQKTEPVPKKEGLKGSSENLVEKRATGEKKEAPEIVQSQTVGVLILAHGMHKEHGSGVSPWEAAVLEAVKPLKDKYPLEVAFGMAEPDTIKDAVRRLEEKGISEVVAVPLFISSHSPIIGNSRYILGLQEELPRTTGIKSLPRIESKVRFRMTGAMDDSLLVAEVLLERATELSINPAKETVILVGHGPNDEEENKLWLGDMGRLAYYVREKGIFREVRVATIRMDAPREIKQRAINELRAVVEGYGKEGRVIVVPHLLAPGVEGEIVEALKGLSYAYNGKTLLPHANITRWIERKVDAEIIPALVEVQK